MSLWSEIKQRRITQVVFAYLAGGWMVTTVIDQVVDREVLPLVVYQVTLTIYLVGILAAVIIGWYHGELGEQKASLREVVLLSVVGVIGLGASGMVIRNAMNQATLADALDPDDLRRIAVLYFEDASRDGSMQAVAEGITEGLINHLVQVQELDVRSRNAAQRARELGDVAPDSIASALGVGAVVDGSVSRSGDDIRVSVRLLEGQTGAPIFRDSYSWPADSVSTIGTDLATEVANALRRELGVELRLRQAQAAAPNSAAWLQVARAERYLKDAEEAVSHGDVDAFVDALETADVELAAAQESAPAWPEPLVLRAQVAHQWRILLEGSPERRDRLVQKLDETVAFATAALELDPDNAGALEWRGTALYTRWLNRVDEGQAADDLFARAREDLERAKRVDPSRARVSSTLSHLYLQTGDWTDAVLEARRAYDQDAYLDVADGVLWRLYSASYQLGEYQNARRGCQEGHARFPEDFRFVQCQILLLTMEEADPDIGAAWALYEEYLPMLGDREDFFAAQARALIGGVIGRAGLPDSANAVFESARVGPEVDPEGEIMVFEAAMRSVMGDVEGAIQTLERFVVRNPDRAPGQSWWWRNLQGEPAFERIQAIH